MRACRPQAGAKRFHVCSSEINRNSAFFRLQKNYIQMKKTIVFAFICCSFFACKKSENLVTFDCIPAALFMAVTKTVFKTHFYNTYISGLKEEVSRVNKILCEGNDSFMFVTVFVAILNLRTGELEYVDAGHEPILHLRCKGKIDQLPKQGCMAIGIDPDHEYISHKVHLNPGDGLFLYSDGVPDAADIDNQRYTLDGTIEFIQSFWKDATAKELNDKLMENLDQFIGEAKQFDDITMLSLKYNPEGDL